LKRCLIWDDPKRVPSTLGVFAFAEQWQPKIFQKKELQGKYLALGFLSRSQLRLYQPGRGILGDLALPGWFFNQIRTSFRHAQSVSMRIIRLGVWILPPLN